MKQAIELLRSGFKRRIDERTSWGRNQLQRELGELTTDTLLEVEDVAEVARFCRMLRDIFQENLVKTNYNSTNARVVFENSLTEAVTLFFS